MACGVDLRAKRALETLLVQALEEHVLCEAMANLMHHHCCDTLCHHFTCRQTTSLATWWTHAWPTGHSVHNQDVIHPYTVARLEAHSSQDGQWDIALPLLL
eukprot:4778558-Amphidinium_carterae.2